MMNPLQMIAAGGRKVGGLLQAAGRNFDRNAAGDLPSIMGADFTPGVQRRARSNAIMAIGSALQGHAPLQQGLQQGQQNLLQGWATKREVGQQNEARAMMQNMGQEMSQAATSSAPDTADGLHIRAQQYEAIGARLAAVGQKDSAKLYFDTAAKLREVAEKRRVTPSGPPVEGVSDGKRVFFQQYSDGSSRVVPYSPPTRTQVINTGGSTRVVDTSSPGEFANTVDPNTKATLGQHQTQFSQMFPLEQRKVAATEMGARASMAGANTGASREAREAREGSPGVRLGDAATSTIADLQIGLQRIHRLGETLSNHKAWTGPIQGLANAPVLGGFLTSIGIDTPAKLEAEIAGVKQVIGKAMEGGVLRKEDEEKYARILPTMSDPPAVVQHKIKLITEGLSGALAVFLQTQRENGRRVGTQALAVPGTPVVPTIPAVGGTFLGGRVVGVTPIP